MPDSVERLDLLLIHEARTRRVRTDGIHFHTFRYLSLTLVAYVGEDVTIRLDPRDMGKIRVLPRTLPLSSHIGRSGGPDGSVTRHGERPEAPQGTTTTYRQRSTENSGNVA